MFTFIHALLMLIYNFVYRDNPEKDHPKSEETKSEAKCEESRCGYDEKQVKKIIPPRKRND